LFLNRRFFCFGKWGEEPKNIYPIGNDAWKNCFFLLLLLLLLLSYYEAGFFSNTMAAFFWESISHNPPMTGSFSIPSKHIFDHCPRRRRIEEFQYSGATAKKTLT